MKTLANFLTAMVLVSFPVFAAGDNTDDDGIKLFAVATLSDTGKELMEGDSVLVTLTLYSNSTFSRIENLDKDVPELKDTDVRPYGSNRRLTQKVSTYGGKRYYSVVAEQFVVTFRGVGSLVFPPRKYNVDLDGTVRSRYRSPFDDFFGFDSPFAENRKTVRKKCSSESLKMKVTKRPPKTMHDIERGGAVLM